MANDFENSLMNAALKVIRGNYNIVTSSPYGVVISDPSTQQTSYFKNKGGHWEVVSEIPDLNSFEYTCRQFGVVFTTLTVSAADPNSASSFRELVSNGGLMEVKLPLSEEVEGIPKAVMAALSNNISATSMATTA